MNGLFDIKGKVVVSDDSKGVTGTVAIVDGGFNSFTI